MAGAAGRIVRAQFDTFTQARLAFVRSIADLSERPEYLEALLAEDAFEALKPMLHDKVATVQQTAALALGRMAGCSIEVAIELVKAGAWAGTGGEGGQRSAHSHNLAQASSASSTRAWTRGAPAT